jgi:hypothetical protein
VDSPRRRRGWAHRDRAGPRFACIHARAGDKRFSSPKRLLALQPSKPMWNAEKVKQPDMVAILTADRNRAAALRPSSSMHSLRPSTTSGHRNMYALAASGSSQSLLSFQHYDPERYAMKMARMRELNSQADLLAESITKQVELSASQASLLPRRRPSSAVLLPSLALRQQLRPKVNRGPPDFINAPRKLGAKPGYVYKIGKKGAGYYRDPSFKGTPEPGALKKELERQLAEKQAALKKPDKEKAPQKQLTHEQKFQQEKELKGLMSMAESGLNSRFSDMYKAFQHLDLDRSGRLSREELKRGMDLWNIPIDDRQLDLIMGDCDQDDDGGVSYEEFVDKLARGTVSTAAMGKRGMQSKEAMGVDSQEMLAEQLGHKKLAKFKSSINS